MFKIDIFTSFYKIILVFLIAINLIGCENTQNKEGKIINVTYDEMISMIDNKDTFILQFSKQNCPYCIELEKVEKKYLRNNSKIIYQFLIDETSNSFEQDMTFISSYFTNLESVPTVYWIEKGKPMNQLPILYNLYQYDVLKKWIEDNENYY